MKKKGKNGSLILIQLIFFNLKHGTNHLFINILSSKNTYIFILKEERYILSA
jgi:hypothetical protein